jgi:hypothetical protein
MSDWLPDAASSIPLSVQVLLVHTHGNGCVTRDTLYLASRRTCFYALCIMPQHTARVLIDTATASSLPFGTCQTARSFSRETAQLGGRGWSRPGGCFTHCLTYHDPLVLGVFPCVHTATAATKAALLQWTYGPLHWCCWLGVYWEPWTWDCLRSLLPELSVILLGCHGLIDVALPSGATLHHPQSAERDWGHVQPGQKKNANMRMRKLACPA